MGSRRRHLLPDDRHRASWEQLVRDNPSVTAYQYRFAQACIDLANLLPAAGRKEDPLPFYQQARALLEKAVAVDLNMAVYHGALGAAWNGIGGQREKQGNKFDAVYALQKAIEHQKTACRLAPHVYQSQRFLWAITITSDCFTETMARPS